MDAEACEEWTWVVAARSPSPTSAGAGPQAPIAGTMPRALPHGPVPPIRTAAVTIAGTRIAGKYSRDVKSRCSARTTAPRPIEAVLNGDRRPVRIDAVRPRTAPHRRRAREASGAIGEAIGD